MKRSYFSLAYRKVGSVRNQSILTLALAALPLFLFASVSSAQIPRSSSPNPLRIAAAADLEPVLPTLEAQYQRATGVRIIASFASSATLTQQILNGDPQDLFLSADAAHPQILVNAGRSTEPSPIPYARGVLVLWARRDSPAQPISLHSLTNPGVRKIAIANGLHAPYGIAADQALTSLHLSSQLASKLVIAENIGQTAEFAESGNAQAALISLTIGNSTHARAIGSFVRIPTATYQPIRQCAVILKSSPNQAEAQRFLRWLTSQKIQQSLPSLGLDPAN
ncbi:MAG: molybdate ABC transporter substrate-binding protein [Acidobacteriaceae bacterium]